MCIESCFRVIQLKLITQLFIWLICVLILSLATQSVLAAPNDNPQLTAKTQKQLALQQLESRFQQVLQQIDSTLLSQHQQLKSKSTELNAFVDNKIIPFWDIELTLRLLVGSKTWKTLKPNEIQKLRLAFVNTMRRYVHEGIKLYDGQRASFVEAQLSRKGKTNKGQITILLEPIYLPSFKIHFKVAKREQDWLLYDVFVEGVSYIKLKKNEYRQIIHQKGVAGLLAHLENKNKALIKTGQLSHSTEATTTSKVKTKSQQDTLPEPGSLPGSTPRSTPDSKLDSNPDSTLN
jgi:phospholipid transport system substrate-binding protein